MGLLSGLGNLGLGKLENADVFEEEKKEAKAAKPAEEVKEKPFDENDWLFDKKCTCPVCDKEFTYRAIKTGKARLIGQDPDLRPRYEKMDPLKYDVIICPYCGYSALTRYLTQVTQGQGKLIKANFAGKIHGVKNSGILSYDDAITRHQLALACAIVKKAKDSEKAYICLKMAWLIRGKKETYDVNAEDYEEVMKQLRADEDEALRTAFDGFAKSRSAETFPIAGMDETTFDYLIAELAFRFNEFDMASRLVSSILTSASVNNRIKDKARNLKERIQFEIKNRKE